MHDIMDGAKNTIIMDILFLFGSLKRVVKMKGCDVMFFDQLNIIWYSSLTT